MFESDLRNVLLEMQNIPASLLSLLGSVQAVHSDITQAINNLYLASYYEKKSTPDEMRLFLEEIRACQNSVHSALMGCKRLLEEE